jgi:hypothetical protein
MNPQRLRNSRAKTTTVRREWPQTTIKINAKTNCLDRGAEQVYLRAVSQFGIAPGASSKAGHGFPLGAIGAIREFQFHQCADLRGQVKSPPINGTIICTGRVG